MIQKFLLIIITGCMLSLSTFAQIQKPVKWAFGVQKISDTEAELIATAKIDGGWHLYSQYLPGTDGPIPTSFKFTTTDGVELIGKVQERGNKQELFEKVFEMKVAFFENEVKFVQKIKVLKPTATVKGTLEFMACNDRTCIPPEEILFEHKLAGYQTAANPVPVPIDEKKNGAQQIIEEKVIKIQNGDTLVNQTVKIENGDTVINEAIATTEKTNENATQTAAAKAPADGLATVFGKGMLGGLAALLMPCVFPMIPLTVSFFTKQNEKRKGRGIFQAIIYGLSIIIIYVGLGLIITAAFGSDALNSLSSNIWFNLLCFGLLIVFGASFLGAFEIQLPSSWANFTDKKSNSGGWLGIFFMAATLAIVSFSCTVGIIGYLLVDAAQGQFFAPAVGMFGFALALAVPFTLFAAFPSLMGNLPKSGGWLNVIKVTLGFLELIFAFKFLSNVDLAYHWNLLDREVFLSIWIVLFFLLGWYLLGKIRFELDSPATHLSVPRFGLAAATLAFACYLVPGLWGAPLNAVNAFLPPMGTQDFVLNQHQTAAHAPKNSGITKKYADLFHCPHNIDCFFDYDQALAYAKQQNKPLFIDFTGHSCVNCRKMEASVWADAKVLNMLTNDYVVVSLYVDDKTELPAAEQYTSKFSKKPINTVGKKWSDLQATRYNSNSQPQYILLNHAEETLSPPQGYDEDVDKFVAFLQAGKSKFAPLVATPH